MIQTRNLIATVHQLIREWQQEVAPGLPVQWEESLLLRDGFLWGRKFRADEFMVVWELAAGRLMFIDDNGQVRETSLPDIAELERPPIAQAA